MYNFTLIVSIFIFAAYVLYHQNTHEINHAVWTQCEPAECQRRQGKINITNYKGDANGK